MDLSELGKSKEKYREFVELQADSLEYIMKQFYLDGTLQNT